MVALESIIHPIQIEAFYCRDPPHPPHSRGLALRLINLTALIGHPYSLAAGLFSTINSFLRDITG